MMKQINYIILILIILFYGCSIMKNNKHNEDSYEKYFTSPQKAVSIITELLKNQDFKKLAAHYNLSSSKVTRSQLESGEFFIRKKRPEVGHPGGFWRYKHPFAPGYKYSHIQPTDKEEVYLISVVIEIDQGEGSMQQSGFSNFFMIKSAKGWQVLPDSYSEKQIVPVTH